MTTIAELNKTVDRFSRRVDTIIAENARRDAEYRAQQAERDAQWQREMKAMQKNFDAEHKKTDAVVRKISSDFNSKWGRFVESLCANQVVPLLNSRGIEVHQTMPRMKTLLPEGGYFEIDITAINGDTLVLIEVKTTLRPEDVKWFIEKLGYARKQFRSWPNHRFLGGVAFLQDDSGAALSAQRYGLFTILATGNGAVITNDEKFTPKEW